MIIIYLPPLLFCDIIQAVYPDPYHVPGLHPGLTDSERAYIAGIVDGEGTIGYYLRKKSSHIRCISIFNTDFNLLRWFQARIPYGKVTVRSARSRGKRTQWTWAISSSQDVKDFLELVAPYLVIKSAQAELLLSLVNREQIGSRKRPYFRIPPDVLAHGNYVESELKRLKTATTIGIH